MKKKVLSRTFAAVLSVTLATSCMTVLPVAAEEQTAAMPEPVMVYDFSHSFDELKTLDAGLEVVENAAKPEIVDDAEMGKVLKLGKAVNTDSQKYMEGTKYIEEDASEYSTINITNPFKDSKEKIVEYGDHDRIDVKIIDSKYQPDWKTGVTISYWIKSSGLNSNVVGFRNNKYLIQADDYAKYLCTVDFDKDYNKYTDEEKKAAGQDVVNCGVMYDSDYYFRYQNDDPTPQTFNGITGPVYINANDMGATYWMNKFYTVGHIPKSDGTPGYDPSSDNGTGRFGSYAEYSVAPIFGTTYGDVNINDSKLKFGWAKGEMWLDSTSSFFFEADNSKSVQENPNADQYGVKAGMQNGNCFAVNSWNGGFSTLEEAVENAMAADSPVTVEPDKWHYVTCIIQNDWVEYYLDGELVNVKDNYSSYGAIGIGGNVNDHEKPWKRFNKGGGSRFGYGNNKNYVTAGKMNQPAPGTNGNYVCEVIMDWLTDGTTTATIGGGNSAGDGYLMYADTDAIEIKNIVYYDEMLTADQIAMLAKNAKYYESWGFAQEGDADGDGDVNAQDALAILKDAAAIEKLDAAKAALADVNGDGELTAEDALGILQYAAKIINSFDELKK